MTDTANLDAGPTAETAALLERLAADLDGGFADLTQAYGGIVYTTALRLCGRPADAEDLAAEAFLRAYRALRGYEPSRIVALTPRAWLVTIVVNVWRNAVRAAGRRGIQVPLDSVAEPAAADESPESRVLRRSTADELADVLGRLPATERVAVVARHVLGLSVAEIAAVLDCPEGTAKSHVSRGLRRLREAHPATNFEEALS